MTLVLEVTFCILKWNHLLLFLSSCPEFPLDEIMQIYVTVQELIEIGNNCHWERTRLLRSERVLISGSEIL